MNGTAHRKHHTPDVRTPCGTGTGCTATGRPGTSRPSSPTASCAAAAGPRVAATTPRTRVAAWKTTDVTANFTVKPYDQAGHGADCFLVYVTRRGFAPVTQSLKWSDLQLVARSGKYAPAGTTRSP
ncbi:lytic polysaccharide monooxygenase [Streptomyces sp. NPDC058735]|uniref:lytic polysaccharide monooxygenase n=1 Tax=unclassified Streptomyces TaxID=2593676 RepID=UPI0036742874